jgi:diguanylate cyclase (GGDEF)-like protein
MDLYAGNEALAPLEEALRGVDGVRSLGPLIALCWHLRQRDTRRATELGARAQSLLDGAGADDAQRARLAVARAECALLMGRTDEAQSLAGNAADLFDAAGDDAGRGDAAQVGARIAEARGERADELARLAESLEAYRRSGDADRIAHGRCAVLLAQGLGDPEVIAGEAAQIRSRSAAHSATVGTHLRFVEGVAAFQRGALIEAVAALGAVAATAYAQGMCDQGFRAEAGLVSAQSNLGDREASCTMAETVLERARSLGWPRAIGHALANFARQLADTGELERAVELLLEARAVLADQPRSRGFAIAAYYLGDACLGLGRHEEALEHLELAEDLMRGLGAQPEVACLLAIQAQALSRLGRPVDALERARRGLELARKIRARLWEAEALRSLAEIHSTHRVRDDAADRAAALEYLNQALAVVEAVGGHHEKSQLYTEIALAHERAGDPPRALEAERLAHAEEVRESSRRAANRLLLARERHETERQSERARALEAALATLEQLRQVGQDITSHLETDGMLRAISRDLSRLADASFVGVFVFDAPGGRLELHGIERGRVLAVREIALADFESYAARAARERREIHVEADEGGRTTARIPGTDVTRSLWFGPLLRGEELLGVLTVQTGKVRAYGEREKLIFRTVAGYAAVAFANARAHGELEAKHRKLVETESEMRLLATTDPLTGLDNRRRFFAQAESELARAMRYGGPVGLIMADLDRFKAVNDEAGHGAGDRVLQAVAQVLRGQQRPHDVVGRLGGEEFACVLPGADLDATARAAERLRGAVEALAVEYEGRGFRVTVSLGCAAIKDATLLEGAVADELESLLRCADAALYEAKGHGRNRIVCAAAVAPAAADQARA